VAGALNAMTFAVGRRFIIVDAVERWKESDVETHLAPSLKDVPPDTTIAFFAREDGRVKAPANLVALVKKAGNVAVEATPKARELPQWAIEEAKGLGVTLERQAAQALVTSVGERQQRLLRELEKLAIEHGPGATLGLEEVEAAAHSAERQVWGLIDAFVAGNEQAATKAFLELRAQGESIARLVPLMARRVRDVLAIATRLEHGESPGQIKESVRGNPWQTEQRIKQARATDSDHLRRALEALADLEIASRGGSELDDDTVALLAL
jgi:DNA polymerase-3 subunit delta